MSVYTHLSEDEFFAFCGLYGVKFGKAIPIVQGVKNSNWFIQTQDDQGDEDVDRPSVDAGQPVAQRLVDEIDERSLEGDLVVAEYPGGGLNADQGEQGRGDEQFLEGSGRRELQRKRGGTLFHVADDGYAVLEVEVEAHDGEGGDGDDDERDEAADESGGGVRKAGADQQPGQAAPGEEEDEERQRGDQ